MAEKPPPSRAPTEPAAPTLPGVPAGRAQRASPGTLRAFGWLAILGIGAAIGAILGAFEVAGWIIGLVVAAATPFLGLILRRSLG